MRPTPQTHAEHPPHYLSRHPLGPPTPPTPAYCLLLQVVAYDYGIKYNILRRLASYGCRITVVPATYPAAEVLKMNPDGVFFSNGPVSLAWACLGGWGQNEGCKGNGERQGRGLGTCA